VLVTVVTIGVVVVNSVLYGVLVVTVTVLVTTRLLPCLCPANADPIVTVGVPVVILATVTGVPGVLVVVVTVVPFVEVDVTIGLPGAVPTIVTLGLHSTDTRLLFCVSVQFTPATLPLVVTNAPVIPPLALITFT
jgi:hypothetical protein